MGGAGSAKLSYQFGCSCFSFSISCFLWIVRKFYNIIDNNKINEKEIAEVLNLKGVIVDAYAPYLNEFPDEGGLFYFAKALNYDEKILEHYLILLTLLIGMI